MAIGRCSSSLGLMKWHRTHRDHLSLTCLDVGHGQAILVQLPGTMNILFDAGSMYNKRRRGADRRCPSWTTSESAVCMPSSPSHHDMDHINGMPEVVDLRRVDRVYLGRHVLRQSQTAADDRSF